MADEAESGARGVRYQPDESPPPALAAALGLQLVLLGAAGIVLMPAIVVRASGWDESYAPWAVFAVLAVCGATTMLQAVRLGRAGAGYVLLMGTSSVFVAVSITALAEGGPALLAALVVASSLVQFALASRLALLRRVVTPTVAGTVVMLISVAVMPVAWDLLTRVPEDAPAAAAPASAALTLAVLAAVALRGGGVWRLWAPVLGVAAGCAAAAAFGIYDAGRIAAAPWVGLPDLRWPGLDLDFGPAFWALLPAFLFATAVSAVETVGDGVAIQGAAWRKPRAVDFRAVQGAVTADGVGNLLSGLAGTVPNTTYSSSVAVAEITRVAARSVGVWAGAWLLALALAPKAIAVVLAIPGPVAGAYLMALMGILFMVGARFVVENGAGPREMLIAGVAFWIGAGFQNGDVFADRLGAWWGALLGNGMAAGGLAAVVMTLFAAAAGPRRRLEAPLEAASLPRVLGFLDGFAEAAGWGGGMAGRLRAVGEETLYALVDRAAPERRILLVARRDGGAAELEFVAAAGGGNIEDRIALLDRGGGGRASARRRPVAPAAAPLRGVGAASAIPRHRHRDGPRRPAGGVGRGDGPERFPDGHSGGRATQFRRQ